jgi:hypothetical protein
VNISEFSTETLKEEIKRRKKLSQKVPLWIRQPLWWKLFDWVDDFSDFKELAEAEGRPDIVDDYLTTLACQIDALCQKRIGEILAKREDMPKIICLCGSTRFTADMLIIQWNFTKQGYVVLSWCALPDGYYSGEDKAHIGDKEGVKEIVDKVHLHKIDLSDEVFVVNIGGYIGESTTNEIKYALAHNKPVKFLEPEWDYPTLKAKYGKGAG